MQRENTVTHTLLCLLRRWILALLACAMLAAPAWADDDDDDDDDTRVEKRVDDDGGDEDDDDEDKKKKRKKRKRKNSKRGKGEINPSSIVVLDDDITAAIVADQAAAHQIRTAVAHQSATGDDVMVAVLDGGFNTDHPAIADNVSSLSYDAVDDDADPNDGGNGIADYADEGIDTAVGHGTAVAGMVLLAAPDAVILAVRVVDDEGFGTIDELERGFEYALDMGADVINLSLEADRMSTQRVEQLITDARKAGVVVVTSAGNDGAESLGTLAGSDKTISVGAVDDDDVIAPFSNGGEEDSSVTVYAPGVDLICPLGWPEKDAMGLCSGTSFSAGIVSGAAALYLELHPSATPQDVHDEIAGAVDAVEDDDGDALEGVGRANLEKLVE